MRHLLRALPALLALGCPLPALAEAEKVARKADLQSAETGARGLLGNFLAQGLSAAPEPAPTAANVEDLEEVTVSGSRTYRRKNSSSATKIDTPILDIPQSVQVIPRQVLEDQGAFRLGEAVRNVSGVAPSSTVGGRVENLTIRGFAANQFQNNVLDDFFSARVFRETANLERIEVVKGPASVLFGRAEPSGIVNLIPKRPTAKPYFSADLTIGSYQLYRTALDLSGPLDADNRAGYRLNLVYEDADSFRERALTARIFVAPVITWKLGPDTTLTLEGEHLRDSRPLDRGLVAVGDGVADIPVDRFLGDPSKLNRFNQSRAYVLLDHRFSPALSMRTGLRFTSALEQRGETLQGGRLRPDNRTLTLSASRSDQYFETYFFQNDLVAKFQTGSIEHTLLFGLELGRLAQRSPLFETASAGSIDIFNPVYQFPIGQFGDNFDSTTRISSFGVYLQDQISLSDNLKLALGGRFDTFSSDDFSNQSPTFVQNRTDAFSPRIGVLYKPASTVALFANFNRSFVPVTGFSATNTPFVPERGTQYEVGIKAELAEGRLFTTLAFYDITKTNVLTTDPANPFFSIQVGEQRSQGIEFDITGQILPGWNVIASYAYTDARISQDNDVPVGNRLNTVPRHSGSLWTTYRFPAESSLAGLGFGIGIFAADERPGDLDNTFTLPGYVRTDAAVYYNHDSLRLALNVKNLFDVRYFEGSQSRSVIVPGQPLTVQGTIGVRF